MPQQLPRQHLAQGIQKGQVPLPPPKSFDTPSLAMSVPQKSSPGLLETPCSKLLLHPTSTPPPLLFWTLPSKRRNQHAWFRAYAPTWWPSDFQMESRSPSP